MVNTAASTRLGAGWCLDTDLESSDDPGVGGSGLGDSELGGKATGLVELVRHGAPVPRFAVVLGSTFRTRARPALAGVLGGFVYDLADADADAGAVAGSDAGSVAEVIERWSPTLVAAVESIPDDDLAAIVGPGGMLAALGSGDAPLAVRSSMVGEDSATASFAGQLRSFIGVAAEPRAIAAAIRGCWASAFSVHALAYAHRSGLDPAALRVAVVVQVCVEADRSGVAFSADPRSGRRDLTVISATHGVGEGVVGGLVDGDEYRVAADGGVDATTGTGSNRHLASPLVRAVIATRAYRVPVCASPVGWVRAAVIVPHASGSHASGCAGADGSTVSTDGLPIISGPASARCEPVPTTATEATIDATSATTPTITPCLTRHFDMLTPPGAVSAETSNRRPYQPGNESCGVRRSSSAPRSPTSHSTAVIASSPSRATAGSRCSSGACCEHPG